MKLTVLSCSKVVVVNCHSDAINLNKMLQNVNDKSYQTLSLCLIYRLSIISADMCEDFGLLLH